MTDSNIVFIGAGNMAASIISGLITKGYPRKQIIASNPSNEKLVVLQQKYGIQTTNDNLTAAAQADILVLAIKPQILDTVCKELRCFFRQHKPLILSIIAGKTTNYIAEQLQQRELPIVRCMPNTPALIGYGITAAFANHYVNHQQRQQTINILDAIGTSLWLDNENQLNDVTAVSGSGPAYFFYFMEALIEAAIAQGLPAATAKKLVEQTALGAAKMAKTTEQSLQELRQQVTSPGGTTEQGLNVLQENHLNEILMNTVSAAKKRAIELASA